VVTIAAAAAFGEVIVVAVPWTRREEAFRSAGGAEAFAGKIVVDAMNPYTEYPKVQDLGARASSEVIAELPGARVAKAFNTIYFETLANSAKPRVLIEERIALPVCSDDSETKKIVSDLIQQIGFAPVDAGKLADSKRQEPFQPLYVGGRRIGGKLHSMAQPGRQVFR
jgi:8-hydroxy-5-deazaflavin:NADPH oxidoreductase